jgi:protein-disulfide isomerase
LKARVLIAETLLLGVAVVAAMAVPGKTKTASGGASPSAAQTRITPASVTYAKSLGSSLAPVRIEVFSDYQCPQCRIFYLNTLRPVIDNYVSTGKVYLIHHDFPLAMHAYSRDAARWATAAAVAGDFETVDEALFTSQEKWEANGQIEPVVAAVLSPADMRKVKTLFTQSATELDAVVETDYNLGRSKNIDSTPSVFVTAHGETHELPPGGISYPLMKQYLDYLLEQH